MIRGGKGGASTGTGLRFEINRDLAATLVKVPGFRVDGTSVFRNGKPVALLVPKHQLYSVLLQPKGIDYRKIISQKLLPDQAIYVFSRKTVFVIEIKYQETPGSVDEKLQTCDFKKKQYRKLVSPLGLEVEYVYVLGEWFNHDRYRDVLRYITDMGCRYFFAEIPLAFLGLEEPMPGGPATGKG